MSKKSFTGGLNSLLGEQAEKPKRGRPQTVFKEITKSTQEGTKEGETRATFIIKEELLDKLKAISYWDRVKLKDALNTALQDYIDKKKPKPRPEEVRTNEQEATQRLIKNPDYKARLPNF